jgi:hypothetical protein
MQARTARAASLPAPDSLDELLDAAAAAAAAAAAGPKGRVRSDQRAPTGTTDRDTSSELHTHGGAASGQQGSAASGQQGGGQSGAAGASPFDVSGDAFDGFDGFGAASDEPFAWDVSVFGVGSLPGPRACPLLSRVIRSLTCPPHASALQG